MIQVINRALNVLELLAQDRSRLYTLSEISKQLKLNNGTCANIIKTLVDRGYIEQESRKLGYRLGSMSYQLTGNHSNKNVLLAAASEPLKRLADTLNESCILSVLNGDTRIVLMEIKSTHELQVINKKEKEIYRTSTGRMILACMPDKKQIEFIQKFGLPSPDAWPGIADDDDLIIELHKIRKKQLAEQISKSQIVGLAVPIFKAKQVFASIGVYLPQSRYTSSMQNKISKELKIIVENVNRELNKNTKEY